MYERILATLLALTLASPAAALDEVDSLRDIAPAVGRCWTAPPGSDGHELTIRFSLRRDGSLFGEPRITYSKLPGRPVEARRFVGSVLGSLSRCLPLPITEELGAAIAGRPLTIRYIAGAEPAVRL